MTPPNRTSPYEGVPTSGWMTVTKELIECYPLAPDALVVFVHDAWAAIFKSSVGPLTIGVDIFPQPQVMGFLLHELIPALISRSHPEWRIGTVGLSEKDLHYAPDPFYSTEIKTSSDRNQIFGNRSYAQPITPGSRPKDGYYLAVNFERFAMSAMSRPNIHRIRLGWLDHGDWIPQRSSTGQQARLTRDALRLKFATLYP